jgi:type II secretory ATPase GspE/PulE/Tfp pilus assembly ATPase PilB-like protein
LLDIHSAMAGVMAAQTGHLVLTTLHVSDAIGILQRLRGMGVPDDVLFDPSIFVGLINQSLLPKLCQSCAVKLTDVIREDGTVPNDIIDNDLFERLKKMLPDLSNVRLRAYDPDRACACPDCGGIGEDGRRLAAEICIPDGTFMDIYQDQGGGKRRAKKHWVTKMKGFTKHMHALQLIREGIVDPATTEEIIGPLDRDVVEVGEEVLELMYG